MQRCLIVDEAPVIRKVAARILVQMGFEVESVPTLTEAEEWLAQKGCGDIVIIGASATDGAAVDLVRLIRATPGNEHVVILAMIVEANLGLMTRLKRAGANGYVFKPFDRELLLKAMQPFIEIASAA